MSRLDEVISDLTSARTSRRTAMKGAAALGLSAAAFSRMGGPLTVSAQEAGLVRWVSPRGTLDVLDDYPYWVAQRFGYFEDLTTEIEPGPTSGQGRLVDAGQADMSYSSPGVYSFDLAAGIPLVSVFQMGAYDVFDFAFPKGSGITDLKQIEGGTVLIGDASWQGICDPEFAQVGADPSTIEYLVAGLSWQENLAQGQADAALCWEGLRAQWKALGYDFDYLLGLNFSEFPANSFQIRRSDFEDPAMNETYIKYLRGWAMGLEFGYLNPRAATQIAMEARPQVAEAFPDLAVAVESMMQLANVYRGDFATREGWGWANLEDWQLFFDTIQSIGQIQEEIQAEEVIKNEYVAGANDFDHAQVQADAESFQLSEAFAAVPEPAASPVASPEA